MVIETGKFTNLDLVEHAIAQLGKPYWYGTCEYPATESLLQRKAKQYRSHYGSGRMARYRADIAKCETVRDCVGMIKGLLWKETGYNAAQDHSADGMRSACVEKGNIGTMPDMPGILVFYKRHVGVYIGGGYVVEARGFKYGVVKTKRTERAWLWWGKCPYLDYVTASEEPRPVQRPLLKLNVKNQDVHIRTLQSLLQPSYKEDINGVFDDTTHNAVCQYQRDRKLEVDGVVGPITWKALIDNMPPYRTKTVSIKGVYSETEAIRITEALKLVGYEIEIGDVVK